MNHFPTTCELSQTFFFDAAHTLDRAIETAASRRIHGHTYNAEVFLTGQPDPKTGMVIDLGLVRREVALLRCSITTSRLSTATHGRTPAVTCLPRPR